MTEIPTWLLGAGVLAFVGFLWQTVAAIYWQNEAKVAREGVVETSQTPHHLGVCLICGCLVNPVYGYMAHGDCIRALDRKSVNPESRSLALLMLTTNMRRIAALGEENPATGVSARMWAIARSSVDQMTCTLTCTLAEITPPQTTAESEQKA